VSHHDYTVPVRLVDQGIDWPGWVGALTALATLVIVALSVRYARNALEDARKTRHGQLILDIGTTWSSAEIGESRELLAKWSDPGIAALVDELWGPTVAIDDPRRFDWRAQRARARAHRRRNDALNEYFRLVRLPNLIELIGGLAVEGAITPRAVYTMWGGGILGAWDGWEEAVRQLRIHQNEAEAYANFEWIATQLRAIHAQRTPGADR
jgi:4-amino-4-deoxy-L-arabinose transferase-like glycosyltransferase